jgi:predicted nucleotidyltransferase
MSEVKNELPQVNLHGFYNYKDSLLDDSVPNGAVIYNEKFDEIATKMDGDWFFVENADTDAVEKNLFENIKNIAVDKSLSEEDKGIKLGAIQVAYKVDTSGGERTVTIDAFTTQGIKEQSAVPKPSKEEYLENKSFGEF